MVHPAHRTSQEPGDLRMDRRIMHEAAPQSYAATTAPSPGGMLDGEADLETWLTLLERLFAGRAGPMAVRLGNGRARSLEAARRTGQPPAFTLWFRHTGVLRGLLLGREPLRFAEA